MRSTHLICATSGGLPRERPGGGDRVLRRFQAFGAPGRSPACSSRLLRADVAAAEHARMFMQANCLHPAMLAPRNLIYRQIMGSGLLWTLIGTAAGVAGAMLAAWQVRLQILDHRQRRHIRIHTEGTGSSAAEGLSVVLPAGRLPVHVRGRDALVTELSRSLDRPARLRRSPSSGRVWVLAGMGGLGKSRLAITPVEVS
jgi:hypothetical protein